MVLRPAAVGGPARSPPPPAPPAADRPAVNGSLTEMVQAAGHLWVKVSRAMLQTDGIATAAVAESVLWWLAVCFYIPGPSVCLGFQEARCNVVVFYRDDHTGGTVAEWSRAWRFHSS